VNCILLQITPIINSTFLLYMMYRQTRRIIITYNYTYTYVFIHSVYWISCFPHADQIFRSCPHHIEDWAGLIYSLVQTNVRKTHGVGRDYCDHNKKCGLCTDALRNSHHLYASFIRRAVVPSLSLPHQQCSAYNSRVSCTSRLIASE
jgi:hypothetical protein